MTCHMIQRRFCMINRKIVVFFSIQVDESIDLANKFQVAFVRFINEVEIQENKRNRYIHSRMFKRLKT